MGYENKVHSTEEFFEMFTNILGGTDNIEKIFDSRYTKLEFCEPSPIIQEVARNLLGLGVHYLYCSDSRCNRHNGKRNIVIMTTSS